MDVVDIAAQTFKLTCESFRVVSNIKESLSRRVNETVLLTNREDVLLCQTKLLETIIGDSTDFQAVGTWDIFECL